VNEAIENRVSEGWAANHLMPAIDGNLAGDEDGSCVRALLDKFKKVAGLLGF